MIRDIIDENETVKVNSREVELLKEHFGDIIIMFTRCWSVPLYATPTVA